MHLPKLGKNSPDSTGSNQGYFLYSAKAIFSSTPKVQQCYHVTGDMDFILVLVVHSMKEYEELTRQLFFGNNSVKNFKTGIVLDIVKAGLNIPFNKQ